MSKKGQKKKKLTFSTVKEWEDYIEEHLHEIDDAEEEYQIKVRLSTIEIGRALVNIWCLKTEENNKYSMKEFNNYAYDKFGYGPKYISNMIAQYRIADFIESQKDIPIKVQNEAQTRPLQVFRENKGQQTVERTYNEEQVLKAWKKAVELANGKDPTGEQVKQAVTELVGPSPKKKMPAEAESENSEAATKRKRKPPPSNTPEPPPMPEQKKKKGASPRKKKAPDPADKPAKGKEREEEEDNQGDIEQMVIEDFSLLGDYQFIMLPASPPTEVVKIRIEYEDDSDIIAFKPGEWLVLLTRMFYVVMLNLYKAPDETISTEYEKVINTIPWPE